MFFIEGGYSEGDAEGSGCTDVKVVGGRGYGGTKLKLVFISNCIIDKTISFKKISLTNHDP